MSKATCTILMRTLNDHHVYYKVRTEAAAAMALVRSHFLLLSGC